MTAQAKTMPPLVTIIIPSYNHQDYIEGCVASVCNQEYESLEVIVIDDGSVDESAKILRELENIYNFELIIRENRGLARTLNEAMDNAKGKYFCTMGSDDIMLPSKTALQVAYMEKHPEIVVCGGNVQYIDSKGHLLTKHEKKLPERTLNFDELFTSSKTGIAAPTAMFRTDILKTLGGYDTKSKLEDLPMWLKLTYAGYEIGAIEDFVLQYRKHDSNTSKNLPLMIKAITDTYSLYDSHLSYNKVMQGFLCSMFLKSAKHDPYLAFSLFRKINYRYYNSKIPRAILRMLSTLIRQQLSTPRELK